MRNLFYSNSIFYKRFLNSYKTNIRYVQETYVKCIKRYGSVSH